MTQPPNYKARAAGGVGGGGPWPPLLPPATLRGAATGGQIRLNPHHLAGLFAAVVVLAKAQVDEIMQRGAVAVGSSSIYPSYTAAAGMLRVLTGVDAPTRDTAQSLDGMYALLHGYLHTLHAALAQLPPPADVFGAKYNPHNANE